MPKRGLIKDMDKLERTLALAITRAEDAPIALYRKIISEIFTRIVMETPQYSGRAVANWNISIGTPDMSYESDVGDELSLTSSGYVNNKAVRQKGDMKWAAEPLRDLKFTLYKIKRGDKVYITNAVKGDRDNGKGSTNYLKDLQNPGYWMDKLRAQNQPYETALESAMFVVEDHLRRGSSPLAGMSGMEKL